MLPTVYSSPSMASPKALAGVVEEIRGQGFANFVVYEWDGGRRELLPVPTPGFTRNAQNLSKISVPENACLDHVISAVAEGKPRLVSAQDCVPVPPDWRQWLERGPAGLLPLISLDTSGRCSHEHLLGIAAVFSDGSRQVTEQELMPLHLLCDEKVLCQRSLQELRKSRLILEALAGLGERFQSLTGRQGLADHAVTVIRELFGATITRCGVLLPTLDGSNTWKYIADYGFPKEILNKSYYGRGEGLTGHVLQCPPGSFIWSPDVEKDLRFSKKYGKDLIRSPEEKGALAFLGVPIYSQYRSAGTLPYGALVCLKRRRNEDEAGHFTNLERYCVQAIAGEFSLALDRQRWREETTLQREWGLRVARIWASGGSKPQVYKGILRLLQEQTPLKHLLLSLVNREGTHIVGQAVVGFREDLVKETVRRIYSLPPSVPEDEDILALIVRERIREPFIVDLTNVDGDDPESCSARYPKHVHRPTAARHRVTDKILLMPMIGFKGDVVGVILAGLFEPVPTFSEEDMRHFAWCASQLAGLIEVRRFDEESHRESEKRLLLSLLETFTRHGPHPWSAKRTVRVLMEGLDELYGFEEALVYSYDEKSQALTGLAGHRLNEKVIQKLTYDVSLSHAGCEHRSSMAKQVFLGREPLFVPDVKEGPVDPEDRKQAGVSDDMAGVGLPLILGDREIGVLNLFHKQPFHLSEELRKQLQAYAQFAAVALQLERSHQELNLTQRKAASQEVIIQQIGRIAEYSASETTSTLRQIAESALEMLTVIVKDTRQFFDAQFCGLFVPNVTVTMPVPEDGRSLDPYDYIKDREFELRAAAYSKELSNVPPQSYSATSLGLTATVLRTLASQVSSNVEEDPRWSRQLPPPLDELFKPFGNRRTWMGVPVLMRGTKHQYLFGVLTLIRGIESSRHTNYFDDRDIAAAEDIAGLIALALYNRQVMGSTRDKVLRWFLHDTTRPLVAIRDVYLPKIERQVGRGQSMDVGKVRQICDWANDTTEFLLAGFHAYGILAGVKSRWERESRPYAVSGLVDGVLRMIDPADKKAAGVQRPLIAPPDLACSHDRMKLMTLLLILLQNSIKSVKCTDKPHKEVRMGISGLDNQITITVEDNGCGFTEETKRRTFEEGLSMFPGEGSSGLGLTIAKRFVDLAGGTIDCDGEPNRGAKFIVRLPGNAQ